MKCFRCKVLKFFSTMFPRKIILLCIGVLVFCCADAQRIFGCKDFCETKVKSCRDFGPCENGTIFKNATECGCCDICVLWLREGDKCDTQVIAPIPRQACGPRLMCDKQEKKCVPVKTQCMADRAEHDNNLFIDLPYQTDKPECDDFGYYKSMVCLSDILCYCVDKNGKRIFGTEIASKVNMTRLEKHCNCSREYEEFPKTVPNGDFLRCLPNGDYDQLQCTEEWCYCMESESPDVIEVTKFNTSLKGLSCYDEKIHRDFDATFRSKCWNERNSLKQMIKKHEDQQIAVLGIDLPECDLDGSYAPVQCRQESCFCVDKEGNPFEGYKVPRHSKEAEDMDCRCVRDKFLIRQEKEKNKNMINFEIYKCAPNGNYRPQDFI